MDLETNHLYTSHRHAQEFDNIQSREIASWFHISLYYELRVSPHELPKEEKYSRTKSTTLIRWIKNVVSAVIISSDEHDDWRTGAVYSRLRYDDGMHKC